MNSLRMHTEHDADDCMDVVRSMTCVCMDMPRSTRLLCTDKYGIGHCVYIDGWTHIRETTVNRHGKINTLISVFGQSRLCANMVRSMRSLSKDVV